MSAVSHTVAISHYYTRRHGHYAVTAENSLVLPENCYVGEHYAAVPVTGECWYRVVWAEMRREIRTVLRDVMT